MFPFLYIGFETIDAYDIKNEKEAYVHTVLNKKKGYDIIPICTTTLLRFSLFFFNNVTFISFSCNLSVKTSDTFRPKKQHTE